MKVWRLCKQAHRSLNGEGARRYPGRWNHRGTRMLYTAGSLSLATLELLVHVELKNIPDDLIQLEIEVPDDASMETLSVTELPENWRDTPGPRVLQALGTQWATAQRTLGLQVPSAVIPSEQNVLLNPDHAEFGRVKITEQKDFVLDPRLI